MSIKKVSTLPAVSSLRPFAGAANTIGAPFLSAYHDFFQISMSGEASGTQFSNQGYASAKLNYFSLTNNLSASLDDSRDLRYITLSAKTAPNASDDGTGSAGIAPVGNTRIHIGQGTNTGSHGLTIMTVGDGIALSGGTTAKGSSTIYLSATDKYAIVPSKDGDYVSLACTEMPETRFEDIQKIDLSEYSLLSNEGKKDLIIEVDIDEEFINVCEEGTIDAISCVTSDPAIVGAKIVDNKIVVSLIADEVPEFVVVKLSGIREGRLNKRFVKFTEEEALRNNNFWGSWK